MKKNHTLIYKSGAEGVLDDARLLVGVVESDPDLSGSTAEGIKMGIGGYRWVRRV